MEGGLSSESDQTLNSSGKGGVFEGDKIRSLFEQVLYAYLSFLSGKQHIANTPALLGDGSPVDLFKLFLVVWRGGGFDSVSEKGLWVFVAEECGIKHELVSSLKLIYITYLKDLDKWLETKVRNVRVHQSFALFLLELKKEVRGSLIEKLGVKKGKDGSWQFSVDDRIPNSWKRKMASLSLPGMLNWVKEVAKNPKDLAFGKLPEFSKWKECNIEEFWVQVLLVREAHLVKSPPNASIVEECSPKGENLPKMQKMQPPSVKTDNNVHNPQSQLRLRCSTRISSSTKPPCPFPCCTASTNKAVACQKEATTKRKRNEEVIPRTKKNPKKRKFDVTDEKSREKKVRVGPTFQADVPEWTGPVAETDPKWLGTKVWPPKDRKFDRGPTFLWGREESFVQMQSSGLCLLREISHCREKDEALLDIGDKPFNFWRFNLMGEEVAIAWTKEEEKEFMEMMKTKTPSVFMSDSGCDFKSGPRWTRTELVSYFFNVHLVRRLAYLSRVIPDKVDSDDDEQEVGLIGNSYYGDDDAGCGSGSKAIECVESKQCTDW